MFSVELMYKYLVFNMSFKAGDFVSSHAERKSRFMKWMNKLLKGGSNRGSLRGGNPPPQFTGDESMILRAPVRSLVYTIFLCFIVGLYCICYYHNH